MKDLGDLARELREAVQQQEALTVRFRGLIRGIEEQAAGDMKVATACPYTEIVAEWNARCAAAGMFRRNGAGSLQAQLLALWRKYPNLDLWRAAFDACAADRHWRGENDRGWRGSLESFVRPSHAHNWFDRGLGATPRVIDNAGPLFAGGLPEDPIEEEVSALLKDFSRPLPTGFTGKDPREVARVPGREEEFTLRMSALRDFLAGDWRYSRG